ncbi:MAG TPA: PKD domain-containing protein, partial [Methanoregulaceae archaeon]|nr:PKD domain-containing protein [Methanoregulaceae archaeon]
MINQTRLPLLLLVLLLVAVPAAAQTTQVTVIRYESDGTTVADQVTHDVAWMESNLPIFGDGRTPYLFQGPIVESSADDPGKWNPTEDSNLEKVNETIRGSYLKDLCNLVGGVQPGGEVKISASDGFAVRLGYDNVMTPLPRQGPPVIAWWTAREGYNYHEGMRLFFGSDTSVNPYGWHVFGHQDMKETMDDKYWGWYGGRGNLPSAAQLSNKFISKIEIFPAPASDWTLLMNGSVQRTITKSYFEQGLSWSGHRAQYTDSDGNVWEGMPLWRLVGYVDDDNEHGQEAFNRTLLEQGYTITVIAPDYQKSFTSGEVAFNSNYIVANTLNGAPLPAQINGKNVWPLKLVGVNATGGKSVGNISEIRLEGVPITVPTVSPTRTVTPSPTITVTPAPTWTIKLSGYTDYTVTSQFWDEAMSCGGHTGIYRDATGEWMGLPLWRLVGLVDDQLGHEVLIGAYNQTLAEMGYTVRVIAGDNYNRTFTSQEIIRSDNYLLASRLNGTALPVQINGKNVWPVKLVGANATGGKSIGNVVEIRLEGLPSAPATPTPTPTVTVPSGGPEILFNGTVSLLPGTFPCRAYNSGEVRQVQNLTPNGALELASKAAGFTYRATDKKWETMGTLLLDGACAYDYNRTTHMVWAYRVNGEKKNDFSSTEGMSVYRLNNNDLVEFYYGLDGADFENAIAVIRVRVQIPQQTVIFDGDLTLVDGTFAAFAYNSGTTRQVNNLTVHGALDAASKKVPFTYNATDKRWEYINSYLIDGIADFNYDKNKNLGWAYAVNGVVMNDNSIDTGMSNLEIKNGDRIEFFYGTRGGSLQSASAVVRIRAFVASAGDYSVELKGARTVTFTKADIEQAKAAGNAASHSDVSGQWQGLPLWYLVGVVDDASTGTPTFDNALAAQGYQVRVTSVDGYNVTLESSEIAGSSGFIIADLLNGAPLAETMWPLRLVGSSVPPHRSVAKIASIELIGLPSGGDANVNFTVDRTTGPAPLVVRFTDHSTNVENRVWDFGDGSRTYNTLSPLHIYRNPGTYTASLTGSGPNGGGTMYQEILVLPPVTPTHTVTPNTTVTVEPTVTGTPGPTVTIVPGRQPYIPHLLPGRVEAEDYDLGGAGVAYQDTTPGNSGGVYRQDDVDIEQNPWEQTPNVGWIRNGEWLAYTVQVGDGGVNSMT